LIGDLVDAAAQRLSGLPARVLTRLVTVVAADNKGSLTTLGRLGTIEQVLTDGVYDVTVTHLEAARMPGPGRLTAVE
jgi:hypothetical protein